MGELAGLFEILLYIEMIINDTFYFTKHFILLRNCQEAKESVPLTFRCNWKLFY